MKDYYKLILEKLLNVYERRDTFVKKKEEIRAIQIEPAKEYKEYIDRYNHEAYRDINVAIQKMEQQKLVSTDLDASGKYTRVKLNLDSVKDVYNATGRIPIPELCESMRNVLMQFQGNSNELIQKVICDFSKRIDEYKKLPYQIQFNSKKLKSILNTLCAIVNLNDETYIRNFSTAIFKDSKEFQKSFRPVIENILYDYTEIIVEKERILEVYNLFDNPTYVSVKGNAVLKYNNSYIDLSDMIGGMKIPNSALQDIVSIAVQAKRVVTVENLTTYHDSEDSNSMFIYLGGFHNTSKQQFLKLVFLQNQDKEYYHKGDLDVYGFSILENLKYKTGIPFEPLEMDINTLERYYKNGLYKHLTPSDRKAMKSDRLQKYQDIFTFMLEHDCKVEQESIKALELLEKM